MDRKLWGRGLLAVFIIMFQAAGGFAWDSVGGANEMDTHKLIVAQAVTILQNDLSGSETTEFLSNLERLSDNLYDLKRGAVWPDFNPDGYDLYQEHFYDPDTGLNFTNGYIPDTAESHTRLYTAMALKKWNDGDFSGAAFDLGTAMHYFADLNEPHHASNRTGGEGTAHTEFEQWVENVKYDYVYDNSGFGTDSDYYTKSVNNYNYITDYLTAEANMCASNAKGLADQAKMTSSWADWEYVAEETMSEAQKSIARIFYRFIHEVTTPTTHAPSDSIGKFHVVFKVADEYEAGTDDSVYVGLQLNDGRTMQFECDLPGNDFSRDLLWGYEFNINDASFTAADVAKVWIKKTDATWLGDDLKLEYMNVYMKGKAVLSQPINQWLGKGGWWNNDVYYNMYVNGLNY